MRQGLFQQNNNKIIRGSIERLGSITVEAKNLDNVSPCFPGNSCNLGVFFLLASFKRQIDPPLLFQHNWRFLKMGDPQVTMNFNTSRHGHP